MPPLQLAQKLASPICNRDSGVVVQHGIEARERPGRKFSLELRIITDFFSREIIIHDATRVGGEHRVLLIVPFESAQRIGEKTKKLLSRCQFAAVLIEQGIGFVHRQISCPRRRELPVPDACCASGACQTFQLRDVVFVHRIEKGAYDWRVAERGLARQRLLDLAVEQFVDVLRSSVAFHRRVTGRSRLAGRSDKDGPHGFLDEPTYVFFMDGDGIEISWRSDPECAVRAIVAQLGEPGVSASYVWFLSATCGLELVKDERDGKKIKRWTGKLIDGKLRVRLAFLTDRALNQSERTALTNIARARVPKFDQSICRTVQPNYIQRLHWDKYPRRAILGKIPTIGRVEGTHDRLAVPDNLATTARWAKAQGQGSHVADHPDAESAVRGIGSDGHLREHMTAAIQHLMRANPIPDAVSFIDHSRAIANKLGSMIEQYRGTIDNNLLKHGRRWGEVYYYFSRISDYALWCLNHPGSLHVKTIKLSKEERTEKTDEPREAIFARVKRVVERAILASRVFSEIAPTILLVAPTGSGKSTATLAAAVDYVTKHPGKTVAILVPRHKLGDELIERLQQEHPGGNYTAAVWRGRHADNPNHPHPEHPGKFIPMCQRGDEAEEVEKAVLDVEHTLCKRGRGDKTIKCPFYDSCAYQLQKEQVKAANIIFAAHECIVHEMPTALGDVSRVIIDENPLDALMFGVDINDQVTLKLDTLRTPLPVNEDKLSRFYSKLLGEAREAVYDALDPLVMETNSHQGVAVPRENLEPFIATPWQGDVAHPLMPRCVGLDDIIDLAKYPPREMRNLTWRGKVEPDIRPNMSKAQLKAKLQEAAGNTTIKIEVMLWELIAAVHSHDPYGRIQLHRDKDGRFIRMVGLRTLAQGWDVPTLICDATGDGELLRAIWPRLEEPEPHGWEQLSRPPSVRVLQCVDRAISKLAVAVEGKNRKKLEQKIEGARQLYAAVLMKALQYGGADVGVIIYKSTREWIEKNCFIPSWLKFMHWGDVTGTNTLQRVRALFVIGRPLASAEDVTRQAEALFGAYISQRAYAVRRKQGQIPIVPDAAGNNTIRVDVWEHPHRIGERLRRQITEGSIIQAIGRARAGLRSPNEPLDIHLWTDVPVPELGPVEPVLWSELEAGVGGVMLAMKGCQLGNIADAVRVFEGLFTADALKKARARGAGMNEATPALTRVFYQRAGAGCKPTDAMFLKGVTDPRGWLEERLGPLTWFAMQQEEGKEQA